MKVSFLFQSHKRKVCCFVFQRFAILLWINKVVLRIGALGRIWALLGFLMTVLFKRTTRSLEDLSKLLCGELWSKALQLITAEVLVLMRKVKPLQAICVWHENHNRGTKRFIQYSISLIAKMCSGVKVWQVSLGWLSNPHGAWVHPGSSPNYLLFLASVYLLDWVSSNVQSYTAVQLPENTSCGPKWMAFWDEKWGSWQPDTALALGLGESAPWACGAGRWDLRVHVPKTLLWLCFLLESRAALDLVSTAAPATVIYIRWEIYIFPIGRPGLWAWFMNWRNEEWGYCWSIVPFPSTSGIQGCWLPSRSHHWLWQRRI